ncbi:Lipoteichoic acid synthase 1 [compost metagenome]
MFMRIYKISFVFFIFLFIFSTFGSRITYANPEYGSNIEVSSGDTIMYDISLGQTQEEIITLNITNTGSKEWDREHFRLSYHILDEKGNMLLNDGIRTELPKSVLPGESVKIVPQIGLPEDNNEWLNKELFIQFDIVEEGVTWLTAINKNNGKLVPIVFTQSISYQIIETADKISWFTGKNKKVEIKIENTGSVNWDSQNSYYLSYHLLDKNYNVVLYDGIRSSFSEKIPPGDTATLLANVKLPSKPGVYYIQWSIVKEGVSWFDSKIDNNTSLPRLNVYSVFLLYFICLFLVIFLSVFTFFIFYYIKFEKKDIIGSVRGTILFYIERADILWLAISLYLKIHWSTIHVTNYVSSNYYVFVNGGLILSLVILNQIGWSRRRIFVGLSINLVSSFILLSDLVYFSYFNDVITTGSIINATQLSSMSDSVASLIKKEQIFTLFGDLPLVLPIYFIVPRFIPFKRKSESKSSRIKLLFSLGCAILISTYLGINFYKVNQSDPFAKGYQNLLRVEDLGLVNFHLYDTTNFIVHKLARLSTEDLNEIQEWKEHKEAQISDPYTGVAKQNSLLMIQSEALQAFVVNLKILDQEVTPNINKFIKDSLYFDNFYDQTYSGRTSDAEFMALNSLYPLPSGSVYTIYGDNTFDALPQILNNYGYSTLSAHGYRASFWNRKKVHSNMGFQNSYFEEDLKLDEQIGMGLSDKTFFIQSVDKIKQLRQPYFAFLISLSNHYPFNAVIPSQFKMNLGDLEGTMLGDYLNSVHYADYAFGQLIEKLKEENMLDNTVIALYGDHDSGIDFSEIKKVLSDQEVSQTEILYDKVPFVIHADNIAGSVIHTNTGHLDITPTLLDLLGIVHSNNVFMGGSVFSKNSPVIFRNGNYIGTNYYSENGVCYSQGSAQECGEFSSQVDEQLSISDRILKYNLIPRLLGN